MTLTSSEILIIAAPIVGAAIVGASAWWSYHIIMRESAARKKAAADRARSFILGESRVDSGLSISERIAASSSSTYHKVPEGVFARQMNENKLPDKSLIDTIAGFDPNLTVAELSPAERLALALLRRNKQALDISQAPAKVGP